MQLPSNASNTSRLIFTASCTTCFGNDGTQPRNISQLQSQIIKSGLDVKGKRQKNTGVLQYSWSYNLHMEYLLTDEESFLAVILPVLIHIGTMGHLSLFDLDEPELHFVRTVSTWHTVLASQLGYWGANWSSSLEHKEKGRPASLLLTLASKVLQYTCTPALTSMSGIPGLDNHSVAQISSVRDQDSSRFNAHRAKIFYRT